MRIHLRNNPIKFHPDPIWNDGALKEVILLILHKKNNNKNKLNSYMRLDPGFKK